MITHNMIISYFAPILSAMTRKYNFWIISNVDNSAKM